MGKFKSCFDLFRKVYGQKNCFELLRIVKKYFYLNGKLLSVLSFESEWVSGNMF